MNADRSGIVSAGWSALVSTLAAILAALVALALCWLWWSWQTGVLAAFVLLAGYAGAMTIGYSLGLRNCTTLARREQGVSRSQRRHGLAVVTAVWILCGLSSEEDFARGLVLAAVALLGLPPPAGLSVGFNLAVVAFKRGTDFRGALGAVRRLHREARRAEWDAALADISFREVR